jgi:hypothetical protein
MATLNRMQFNERRLPLGGWSRTGSPTASCLLIPLMLSSTSPRQFLACGEGPPCIRRLAADRVSRPDRGLPQNLEKGGMARPSILLPRFRRTWSCHPCKESQRKPAPMPRTFEALLHTFRAQMRSPLFVPRGTYFRRVGQKRPRSPFSARATYTRVARLARPAEHVG